MKEEIGEVVFIATYAISDIHRQYDMFMELLDIIKLKETDTLYILGDVLDRGSHPVKVLRKLMEMPNAICIVGNHELMALECLEFLMKEITDISIEELDEEMLDNLVAWQYNGSKSTMDEFSKLSMEEKQNIIDFIKEFLIYEEVTISDQDYLLVYAGLGNYSPGKDMEDYSLHELVWTRADYDEQYFEDRFVITGHTPTQSIKDNPRPGFIYRKNHHIAIDCGAHYPGGRLAAICLDTGEEFYSSSNVMKSITEKKEELEKREDVGKPSFLKQRVTPEKKRRALVLQGGEKELKRLEKYSMFQKNFGAYNDMDDLEFAAECERKVCNI